jgi:hypothetical protein
MVSATNGEVTTILKIYTKGYIEDKTRYGASFEGDVLSLGLPTRIDRITARIWFRGIDLFDSDDEKYADILASPDIRIRLTT